MLGRCPPDLLDRVHRERSGALEPEFVAGALEQLQKRVSVAGGAMAELGALPVRACQPGELAAPDQQFRQPLVVGRDCRERGDDSRCAMAPLRPGPCPAPGGSSAGGHWQSPSSCWAYFSSRRDRALLQLSAAGRVEEIASGEREDVAGEAVCRAETWRG